jgi:large exoprotein involved in heme utilization and adhesion
MTTPQLVMGDRAEIAANNRGLGQPGTATLNVGTLVLQGGAEVRASSVGNRTNNFTAGTGGTLTVNADRIRLSGSGILPSEAIPGALEQFPSSLAALTTSTGAAGNLQIQTSLLEVGDRAEISVLGTRTGAAGNLTVTSRQILLSNNGQITASTNAGSGAQITLQRLDLLVLRNRSQITAEAFNQGNGGNLAILALQGFVVATPDADSNIVANAFGGDGGNILIQARSILGLVAGRSLPDNGSNDIDASSAFGRPGTVTLLQPEVDPSRGLTALPTDLTDPSRQIARGCTPSSTVATASSQFIVSGRGGLPPAPSDPLSLSHPTAAWVRMEGQGQAGDRFFTGSTPPSNRLPLPPDRVEQNRLVEAQGWIRNDRGAIALVGLPPISPINRSSVLNHSVTRGDRCPA